MKRTVALVAAIFVWTALFAQSDTGDDVSYYGVDFSRTKVFGAAETGWEFKEAFGKINSLVIAEWPKYDPGKFLYKNVGLRDISATSRLNDGIDPSQIAVSSSDYAIPKDDIGDMIRKYELSQSKGTGLVIIAERLDKSTNTGTFIVVCFDIASREVLHVRGMAGKARGFGLRNYWAGALYDALRGIRQ